MKNDLIHLENELNNNNVFIIGGGYSIKLLDLSVLAGQKIIVINDGYEIVPNITAIYWCDPSWADSRYKDLEKLPCNLKFTKAKHGDININGPYDSTVLNHTGDYGYDPEKSAVRGNNGGSQVLNLVFNMRPKRIFLLGYDMKRINNKTHYHNKHQLIVTDDIYKNLFIPSIHSMAEEFKKIPNSPEIINCSVDSALTCFPRYNLETYIDSFKL